MAFVKELVSEADKELYQSFQMYDYNHNTISGLKLYTNWAVDRERKIYFTYPGGKRGKSQEKPDRNHLWKGKN